MYTHQVEFSEAFDRALGQGPEGPTYVPPARRPVSRRERAQAWAWYRWGWGQRPGPRHDGVQTLSVDEVGEQRTGRHSAEDLLPSPADLEDLLRDDVA